MAGSDKKFLAELRQRNVFRVGAAYVVIAWLVAQVAELGLDSFEAPAWVIQALLLVLALGLPITLFLAWVYELTPEGIKRESEVDRSQSVTVSTGRKLNVVIISALSIALAYFVLNHDWSGGNRVADSGDDKSIAVLPFVDLSEAGDQEFFADGIAEEILNVLVRIPDLQVAGRTSSFSFKGRNEDLRGIGAALGVDHVLEGSVRRAGSRLRITAQLIRSEDGFHVWSETFDRQATDIFDIQDEIAGAVAVALAASLNLTYTTPTQQRTDDFAVYEDYLKAKQLFLKRGKENLDEALVYLNQATTRDPNFAPAWSLIAAVYAVYDAYVDRDVAIDNYQEWRARGKAAAQRALSLQADSAFAHSVLGIFYGYDKDHIRALQELDRSVELAPDNSDVLDTAAQGLLDVGYFREANTLASRAVEIDPLAAIYRNTLGRSFVGLNKPDLALEQFDEAIALDPSLPFPYNNKGNVIAAAGDVDAFREYGAQRVARGLAEQKDVDAIVEVLRIRDDQAALNELARTAENAFLIFTALSFITDPEPFVQQISERVWQQEYRREPGLFLTAARPGFYSSPIWKKQIRKDGLLDLWRSRGFPAQCRPLDGDDFKCGFDGSDDAPGQSFVH